jgi:hydroxymethylpyrimidine/phosphomethylpyrimidine kinase
MRSAGAERGKTAVTMPVALAVGGLDPSGGAGVLADVRAMAAVGVWGAAVCTALTVQSTRGLVAVEAVAPELVTAQLEEIFAAMPIAAVKTGALGSAANVRALLAVLARHPKVPLVVDPVMRPSRGRSAKVTLASGGALDELAARATLLTPNVPEAEALLGVRIRSHDDARAAAEALRGWGAHAVLLKGGHLRGPSVVDWLATAHGVKRFTHVRRRVPEIHGTGCVLAALVAAELVALPNGLEPAVRRAIATLVHWLPRARAVGKGMPVLAGGGAS